MCQSGFSVAGVSSRTLYRSLCQNCFATDRVLVCVAECNQVVQGFLLVVLDWRSFWRQFVVRHPAVGACVFCRRLVRWVKRILCGRREAPEGAAYSVQIGVYQQERRCWSDSSGNIAKVLYVYTDPDSRLQGLARQLYEYSFGVLKKRGIDRCDARIDFDNTSSIKLHMKAGFRLEQQRTGYFATVNL
jgi:GNAT superfamily N-acetyltransferase